MTENNIKIITIFGIIFSIFLIIYILQICFTDNTTSELTTDINKANSTMINNEIELTTIKKRKKKILKRIQQPVCTKLEYFDKKLFELINEIKLKQTQCLPCQKRYYEDIWLKEKYKIEEKKRLLNKDSDEILDNESRGIGVVWCVVGLLIVSMIASIIDVLNAKKPKFQKANSFDIAGKPGAAPRRCSLASLTVSRHTRRQQYISKRPSSIAESAPKTSSTTQAAGRRESVWQRSSSPSGSIGDMMIALQKETFGIIGDSEEELSASPDRLHKRIRLIRRF